MGDGEMTRPHGIIVFGANGAGKTTLARELACILNFKHMDIESYAFEPSEIPYTAPRSREDCARLMLADIERYGEFVISAVTGEFGAEITAMYDLAVFLEVSAEIRVRRVEQREYEKHGKRILAGGDMYEQHVKFMDFAASRSLTQIERYAETLPCPVLRVDGRVDCRTNASSVAEFYIKRFISIGLLEFPDGAEVVRRVSARGVCVRDGKALMIKYKWPGYGFPGGGVEPGESNEQAVVRELSEEIGCNVTSVGKFLMSVTERMVSEASPGKYFEKVNLYYECEVDAESAFIPHPTPQEIDREYESVWIDLETALSENNPIPQRERDAAVLKWLQSNKLKERK
jgi:8-oxo-dGTP pyrophosphatase MutT (NUDIX family)/thymidylate kinase